MIFTDALPQLSCSPMAAATTQKQFRKQTNNKQPVPEFTTIFGAIFVVVVLVLVVVVVAAVVFDVCVQPGCPGSQALSRIFRYSFKHVRSDQATVPACE